MGDCTIFPAILKAPLSIAPSNSTAGTTWTTMTALMKNTNALARTPLCAGISATPERNKAPTQD